MKKLLRTLTMTGTCMLLISTSRSQFNGTYPPLTTTAPTPTPIPAVGWNNNSLTGSFGPAAPWQWYGTFIWSTSASTNFPLTGVTGLNAPVVNGSSGITTINFAGMANGVLPAGSYLYLGDFDSGNHEFIELEAYDSALINPSIVGGRWLNHLPNTWHYPAGGNTVPTALVVAPGFYRFTGGNTNDTRTLVMRTSRNIRTLIVRKAHVNNGFGIGAPPATTFSGNEQFVSGCCEGRNYVKNPTFQSGNSGFVSQFGFTTGPALGPLQYGIYSGSKVWTMLGTPPIVVDEVTNSMLSGSFLVARVTNVQTVVWRQTINVPKGELVACARVKPFYKFQSPWPGVDVTFRFTPTNLHTKTWFPLTGANSWHDFSATYGHSGGPVTMEILAKVGVNAGTATPFPHWFQQPVYLALDNISLKPKTLTVPFNLLPIATDLTYQNYNTLTGNYNVQVTVPQLAIPPMAYGWWIEEAGNPSNQISNPPQWWGNPQVTTMKFWGFDGTGSVWPPISPSNLSINNPPPGSEGKFIKGKTYKITYGVWGKCQRWAAAQWVVGYFSSNKKDGPPEIKRLPDDPKATPPKGFDPNKFDAVMRPNKAPETRPERPIRPGGAQ